MRFRSFDDRQAGRQDSLLPDRRRRTHILQLDQDEVLVTCSILTGWILIRETGAEEFTFWNWIEMRFKSFVNRLESLQRVLFIQCPF